MSETIEINIKGHEDVSPEFRKVTVSLDSISDAMARVIQTEAQMAINAQAEQAVAGMTKAEKEQFMAARDLEDQNKDLGLSFTEINSAIQIGKMVLGEAKKIYEETFGEFQTYAGDVRDLALATETHGDEASRTLQLLDDYEISNQDLMAAMKKLKDNGIVPTSGALIDIAEKYQAITDPAQKAQFAQDNLGKSYQKFTNFLNADTDALRENAEQVNKNLILSDETIAKSEKERLAVDALSDTYQGYKIQAGAALGEMILKQSEYQIALEQLKGANNEWGFGISDADVKLQIQANHLREAVEAADAYYAEVYGGIRKVSEAQTELVEIDGEAVKSAMQVHDTYVQLGDKMAALQGDHDQLLAKKQELIEQGWWPESEKIQAVNDKLAENEQKQHDVTTAMQGTLTQMLLNTAAAGLDAEGQLALARATGQIDEETYAALTAQQELKKQYDDGKISAQEYAKKTTDLKTAVSNLQSKHITITIDSILNEVRSIAGSYDTLKADGGPTITVGDKRGHAAGGITTGPDSGHWELLHGTEAVIPLQNGSIPVQMQGAGGMNGGVTLVVNYAPGISFGDESEARSKMWPFILDAIQTAKANGQI